MNQKTIVASFLICFSITVLVVVGVVGVVVATPKELGYGFIQTSYALNGTNAAMNGTNAAMNGTNATLSKNVQITSADTKEATDGKSLDIDLQVQPFPVTQSGNSQFKITFLQPSSQTVQVHVDYDLSISKMNNEVFRASSSTGQPLLHTAEGIVTIPYKFSQGGEYSVQVSVMGINFIPIKTEQASFDLKVS